MPRGVVQIDPKLTIGQPATQRASRNVQAFNKDVKVFAVNDVTKLTKQQLTDVINQDAEAVLGKGSRSKTTIPFDGAIQNNPYALALTHRVPLNIYQPTNVFKRDAQGNVTFKPWLWRFGTTPAANKYIRNYNAVNCQGDPAADGAFPADEFNRQKRTARNRQYKRDQRARNETPPVSPQPKRRRR